LLTGPEAEGEEVPVGEEDGEDAASEGDDERVDADGGMDFGAGDRDGEIKADQGQSSERNCAEEKQNGPKAEGAERIKRFVGAEKRDDKRKSSEERNSANTKMFYILELAQ